VEPQEIRFYDGQGRPQVEEMDVPVPMVGSLSTTLDARFVDIDAPGVVTAGDGRGNTVVNATLLLFEPIGSNEATVTWSASVSDAIVPEVGIQILPVDSKSFGTMRTTEETYANLEDGLKQLTTGAVIVDSNAQLLANGAAQLLDGLEQLSDGATQLNEGLAGSAARARSSSPTGSGRRATAGDQLASGLGELDDGANQLADGMGTAAAGGDALADGLGELSDGADQLADGMGSVLRFPMRSDLRYVPLWPTRSGTPSPQRCRELLRMRSRRTLRVRCRVRSGRRWSAGSPRRSRAHFRSSSPPP
jgi:putative membrane protein